MIQITKKIGQFSVTLTEQKGGKFSLIKTVQAGNQKLEMGSLQVDKAGNVVASRRDGRPFDDKVELKNFLDNSLDDLGLKTDSLGNRKLMETAFLAHAQDTARKV